VSFANARWGSRPELAKAKRVAGSLALAPLLGGRIDIDRLTLFEPDVLLETNAKGVGNWVLGRPSPAAPAAERSQVSAGYSRSATGRRSGPSCPPSDGCG
jgi:uncharacterized protein involved in outer membrane biogenesis